MLLKSKLTKQVLLLSLVMLFIGLCNISAETWKITSLDWQPYSGSDMVNKGNSLQKLENLLKSEGIELIVEFYPWARAQHTAKTPDYVGYFPAWPEEVTEGFIASEAIDWSEIAVMKRTNLAIKFTNLEDLFSNYKMGLIETYEYPQEIVDLAKKFPKNIDYSPNEAALVRKISAERNDLGITDPLVMQYYANRHGISNVEIFEVLMKKELVLAFRDSPDNLKRIELLNKLLK